MAHVPVPMFHVLGTSTFPEMRTFPFSRYKMIPQVPVPIRMPAHIELDSTRARSKTGLAGFHGARPIFRQGGFGSRAGWFGW
jgi:hypothetical protein